MIALVLLVAAVVLLAAAEWPRLVGRGRRADGHAAAASRRVAPSAWSSRRRSDEFPRSVERDLANLPTIDDPRAEPR